MDADELDQRSQAIQEKMKAAYRRPKVAIRLDVLSKVMSDLDANPTLREFLGDPVCSKVAIVSEMNDLKLGDVDAANLTEEQKTVFKQEVENALTSRISEYMREAGNNA